MKCLFCKGDLVSRFQIKYCSRACSQKTPLNKSRDMSHRKIKHNVQICTNCNTIKKRNKSKLCKNCSIIHSSKKQKKTRLKLRERLLNKTIKQYSGKFFGTSNAYVHIRSLARNIMSDLGVTKECYNCKYNKHVEVAHLRAIKDFKPNTKLKIVNKLSNLKYMCPNCHWEYDNNLLNLK